MKKSIIITLFFIIFCSVSVLAQQIDVEYKPSVRVVIDTKEIGFKTANDIHIYPIMYEGNVYLPLRTICEFLGKEVIWNNSTIELKGEVEPKFVEPSQTPEQNKNIIAISKQNLKILIDGVEQELIDVNGKILYPLIYNDTTYLPVRAISEIMGKEVGWNRQTTTVYIGQRDDLFVAPAGTALKNDFFECTVNSVVEEDRIEEYIPELEGNKFVIVNVTIKNTFPEPIPMYCRDFRLKWGESAAETAEPYGKKFDSQIENSFTLGVDEIINGDIIFEIPKNINDIKLEYIEVYDDLTVGNTYQIDIKIRKE